MEEYKEILTSYHEKDYFKDNEEHVNECLELIQKIVNTLIECDHDNNVEIFESFCKNSIIDDLTYLAIYVENYDVRFQIIKSFSMLILQVHLTIHFQMYLYFLHLILMDFLFHDESDLKQNIYLHPLLRFLILNIRRRDISYINYLFNLFFEFFIIFYFFICFKDDDG